MNDATDETRGFERAWLDFVPPSADAYLTSFTRGYERGARSVRIEPMYPLGIAVACGIANTFGAAVRINDSTTAPDCLILMETDAAALSTHLQALIDSPCQVVAPITSRFVQNQSVFLLTLPKAGTHLLYHLMLSFGILSGGPAPPLRAAHFHTLVHDHPHTDAAWFFQELANHPRGGVAHPFFATPALFIYRNPLDVVVSETFYFTRKEMTPLAHYYTTFSDAERCLSLIVDDPLLKGIRERVRGYLAWMRLPNVIPVSFEELIGSRGDGSDAAQQRTIWSLQLKLHVAGNPRELGARIFRPDSPTFREGKINSHRQFFRAEHYAAFRGLNPDFMHELGYDLDDSFQPGYLPRFVETFRCRPLRLEPGGS